MKYLLIINPVSGHGYGDQVAPVLQALFKEFGLDYQLAATEYPWHAAELAERAARQGFDVVVCASGDGTVNEAINGLMLARAQGLQHTALGIISIGTGNDLAASLGLPADLRETVQILKTGSRRWIDIGFARCEEIPEGRYFGNCVGIGFDAAGTILARKITYVNGWLAYLIAAVQTILSYYASAPTLQIKMDGETVTQKSLMVSIMNGRRIGGGFWTAPGAKADDGLFDLCIARTASRLRMFSFIPHFIKGTQATQPEIRMAQAKNVEIKALLGTFPIQMDGEIICEAGHELNIEVLSKQLEVIGFAQ